MRDLNRTFPTHIFFMQRQGQGQRALYSVLRAYAVHDPGVSGVGAVDGEAEAARAVGLGGALHMGGGWRAWFPWACAGTHLRFLSDAWLDVRPVAWTWGSEQLTALEQLCDCASTFRPAWSCQRAFYATFTHVWLRLCIYVCRWATCRAWASWRRCCCCT